MKSLVFMGILQKKRTYKMEEPTVTFENVSAG